MTERVNHERVFNFFVYVRTAEGTTSDSLFVLFIWLLCLLLGEGNGDILTGEQFCGKNLLITYLFCRTEKRLPVSHKMNDMKKL